MESLHELKIVQVLPAQFKNNGAFARNTYADTFGARLRPCSCSNMANRMSLSGPETPPRPRSSRNATRSGVRIPPLLERPWRPSWAAQRRQRAARESASI